MGTPDQQPSTIYLVGAGPGDPDLITVKGLDLVERCEVLVYDSLVSAELVLRCPATEKHYVGKTAGGHAVPQDQITDLLVKLATAPGPPRTIVRLKGGDPYVFGRGGEEALACVRAGIPVEVVPGVPAGIAVPAYAGVPVTHRDLSSGVTFITGHQARDRALDLPWAQLVGSRLTLVFYMAVSSLPVIAEQLLAHGMAADTPALVVQEGTLPGQRQVEGRLDEIVTLAESASIRPPALVVIGAVAALGQQLLQQQPRPLAGRTVVLVRAEEHHYPEARRMRAAGARVVDVPGVRCRSRLDDPAVRSAVAAISAGDVVVFTSAMGAKFFAEAWSAAGFADETEAEPTLVAGSPSVARALARAGLHASIMPTMARAGKVLETLLDEGVESGTVVWLPRSTSADRHLPDSLEAAGFQARTIELYETVPVPLTLDVQSMLAHDRVDAILFLSGTCVESVLGAVPALTREDERHLLAAAVGPRTAATAAALGLPCEVIADPPGLEGLVDAVMRALSA